MQSKAPSVLPKPSAELLEAQARLLQLRVRLGIEVKAAPQPLWSATQKPEPINWLRLNAEAELQERREQAGILDTCQSSCLTSNYDQARLPQSESEPASLPASSRTIIVHPTLVLALLKQQLEAAGRVYFLLRFIDHQGRGWLEMEEIRRELTQKDSLLRICGWRRLRQLLQQGEGKFWHRGDQNRLWLEGLHRIAYTLDSGRLQGFPY